MESIWTSSWTAYGRHHSIGIPYGFHSGYGKIKWLGCQPKNGPCPVHGMSPLNSMEKPIKWAVKNSVNVRIQTLDLVKMSRVQAEQRSNR